MRRFICLPSRRLPVFLAAGAAAALLGTGFAGGLLAASGGKVRVVMSQPLPNVPGKNLTAVEVTYPPGASTPAHHHAGSVFVYVLSGEIRSAINGEQPRVYRAGEAFFEPPGSHHTTSANASTSEPASLLAVLVANKGAKLTTMDQK